MGASVTQGHFKNASKLLQSGACQLPTGSAAGCACGQTHAAEDRRRSFVKAQQIEVVVGMESDQEGVVLSADVDRAEVEANFVIAAYAIETLIRRPVAVSEQVGASRIVRAAWVAVIHGAGDANCQGGHGNPMPDDNGSGL